MAWIQKDQTSMKRVTFYIYSFFSPPEFSDLFFGTLISAPIIHLSSTYTSFAFCFVLLFSVFLSQRRLKMKIWLSVFALLVVSRIFQVDVHGVAPPQPQVPCYFIFGDSLADNGNNNLLPTEARANYPPYGIDYPHGLTGRFTNGRTTVDMIAELLGFDKHIPPFTTANGSDILKGVNYASGSAGILNETGRHLGAHISLDGQLKNHQVTVSRIGGILGKNVSEATEYLNKCLYSVGMGSNDYINNYFLPKFYPAKRLFSPRQYAKVLMQQYSQQIQSLYNYGARKFALFGVGKIGCTPNANSVHGKNGSLCVDKMNHAVRHFNVELKLLINELNSNLTDAKFIYINTFRMGSINVSAFGFKIWDVGCCQAGENGQCIPKQNTICKKRNEYLFWDSFHPTEAVNKITAMRSYSTADEYDAYPMDIKSLAKL